MALHVADPEVSKLVTKLAKLEKITKTELLRRLLRKALEGRERAKKRKHFFEIATRVGNEAREKGIPPVTKEEMDWLWGMDQLDDH
ncbi:MAG TPA: type II toxin-antitoxin system VapB family antitoxin [Bryobacteraceae bacterium]|nr:type II toxin-antitoxin system VapB family antitoxin [Bryobacteraceae bacterium]